MSAREEIGIIDVESRVIEGDDQQHDVAVAAPAVNEEQPPVLNLLPALVAQSEIAKANPALVLMRQLIARIETELPTIDVATTKGEKRARELRAECVSLRTTTDKAYDAWNKPLLEAQRGIRAVVKQVESGITPTETKLDEMIKNVDAAREAEKQRKVEAEQARVAALRTKIEGLMGYTLAAVKMTSAQIDAQIRELQDLPITDADDSFGEFSDEASGLRGRVISELLEMSNAKRSQEDEAARLERQRVEQLETERRQTAERALRTKIDGIKAKAFEAFGKKHAVIAAVQASLTAMEPTEVEFGELFHEAHNTWQDALDTITGAAMAQKGIEDQQAENARVQADLERQREEQAAAERRRIAAEAAEKKRIEDEAAAAVRAKQERDERIAARIANLRSAGQNLGASSASQLALTIDQVTKVTIDVDAFGEQQEAAAAAKQEALLNLSAAHRAALAAEEAEAERVRQAEEKAAREAAEREAAEASALDSEAETFEEVAQNIITTLQLADYPSAEAGAKLVAAVLTDERVLAALRNIKEQA